MFIIHKLYENLTSNYYMMVFLVGGGGGGGGMEGIDISYSWHLSLWDGTFIIFISLESFYYNIFFSP